jgi:hypothetical protein
MFVSKKEKRKLEKLFIEEFLPTMNLTYEEYVAIDKLEKEAIMRAFRNWLRKRKENESV